MKIVKNIPYLEITEVTLIHFNVVNNSYQQNSKILYKLVLKKSFGQLLNILPKNFIFLKLFTLNFYTLKCVLKIKFLIFLRWKIK